MKNPIKNKDKRKEKGKPWRRVRRGSGSMDFRIDSGIEPQIRHADPWFNARRDQSADRASTPPQQRYGDLGFRLVRRVR